MQAINHYYHLIAVNSVEFLYSESPEPLRTFAYAHDIKHNNLIGTESAKEKPTIRNNNFYVINGVHTMNNKILCLFMLVGLSFQTQATLISFDPVSQTTDVGSDVSFDLRISDLGDDILTGFDINVSFDDTILSFVGFTFGTGLDTFGFGTLNSVINYGGGLVNVFELSFDFDEDLMLFQPNDFVLGTFTFTGIKAGTSELVIAYFDLVGEYVFDQVLDFYVPKTLSSNLASGSLEVQDVPEPATFILFMGGVLAMGMRKKSKVVRV